MFRWWPFFSDCGLYYAHYVCVENFSRWHFSIYSSCSTFGWQVCILISYYAQMSLDPTEMSITLTEECYINCCTSVNIGKLWVFDLRGSNTLWEAEKKCAIAWWTIAFNNVLQLQFWLRTFLWSILRLHQAVNHSAFEQVLLLQLPPGFPFLSHKYIFEHCCTLPYALQRLSAFPFCELQDLFIIINGHTWSDWELPRRHFWSRSFPDKRDWIELKYKFLSFPDVEGFVRSYLNRGCS